MKTDKQQQQEAGPDHLLADDAPISGGQGNETPEEREVGRPVDEGQQAGEMDFQVQFHLPALLPSLPAGTQRHAAATACLKEDGKGSISGTAITLSAGGGEELQVELPAYLLHELEEYARRETEREHGALLLGRFITEGGGLCVRIEAWIEARYAQSSRVQLKFTHKTWDYVAAVHERQYPDLQVVGWFHTHPGFGVFLSAYDLFIQRHFFRGSGQVALVCDPVQQETGIFCWRGDAIVPWQYTLTGVRMTRGKEGGAAPQKRRKRMGAAAAAGKAVSTPTDDDPSALLTNTLLILVGIALVLVIISILSGLTLLRSGEELPVLRLDTYPGVHMWTVQSLSHAGSPVQEWGRFAGFEGADAASAMGFQAGRVV